MLEKPAASAAVSSISLTDAADTACMRCLRTGAAHRVVHDSETHDATQSKKSV